jgi:hypothetical protein
MIDDYTMTDAEADALRGFRNPPLIPILACPYARHLNKETEYTLLVDGVPVVAELVQYELTTRDGRLCLWITRDEYDADYFYFDPNRVVLMER